MTANLTLRYCVASAFLLQACTMSSAPPELAARSAAQARPSTNETAEAYFQLGRTHQAHGNLELALSGYTYAIARDARHMEARNAAAAIHAQQGRLEQARAMMLAVIADDPSASQAHNNLGYIDYLRGAHAGAAQAIRRALALDPRNHRAQNNLRLVDAALAAATPARDAAPVPERAPQLELIQVVPNVYELKMMPKAAAPVLLDEPLLAAAPLPVLATAARTRSRVEVANGDGTPGLARRVGALLGQRGYPVARLSNELPYGQRSTRIEFRPGYAQQAEALRALIDGAVLLAPVPSLAADADLRVVLGRDTQRAMALREGVAASRLATR
jgi:Flp pilus assembly protein TadD